MSKKKRKRKISGTIRLAAPRPAANREQDELSRLMEPILAAIAAHQPEALPEARRIWESEAEGVLAWGVRSGYFLWVRQHPGNIPTLLQISGWMQKGRSFQV